MILSDTEKHEQLLRKKLYTVWAGMKNRCDNPNNPSYPVYGGRGIRVCPEWYDFEKFYAWAIASGYTYERESVYSTKNKWSIDRIDFNGNYCPSNCRWTDDLTQARNTRQGRFLFVNGVYVDLFKCEKELNIPRDYLARKIKEGRTFEEACNLYSGFYKQHLVFCSDTEYAQILNLLQTLRQDHHKAEIINADVLSKKIQENKVSEHLVEKIEAKKPNTLPIWLEEILNNNWSSYSSLTKDELKIANSPQIHNFVEKYQKASEEEREVIHTEVTELYGVEHE